MAALWSKKKALEGKGSLPVEENGASGLAESFDGEEQRARDGDFPEAADSSRETGLRKVREKAAGVSESAAPWQTYLRSWMRMIRVEHTLLALPGVFLGAFLAAAQSGMAFPPLWSLLWLTVAVAGLRSFAVTLDRLVNLDVDRLNVRIAANALVSGEISVNTARVFAFLSAAVYFTACLCLNRLILLLAPLPVLCVIAGAWARRLTWLVHFVRGLCCGFAPLAGWIGVTPEFSLTAALFGCAVAFQAASFDMLRSVRNVDFDIACRLHSAPVHFGVPVTASLAGLCQAVFALFLGMSFWAAGFGLWGLAGWAAVVALLIGGHVMRGSGNSVRAGTSLFAFQALIAGVIIVVTLFAL